MAEKEQNDTNAGPLRRSDSEASKSEGKQGHGKPVLPKPRSGEGRRILLRTFGWPMVTVARDDFEAVGEDK